MVGLKGSVRHSSSGPVGTTSVWPAKHSTGPPVPRVAQKFSTLPKSSFSILKPAVCEPLDHQLLAAAVRRGHRGAGDEVQGQVEGVRNLQCTAFRGD